MLPCASGTTCILRCIHTGFYVASMQGQAFSPLSVRSSFMVFASYLIPVTRKHPVFPPPEPFDQAVLFPVGALYLVNRCRSPGGVFCLSKPLPQRSGAHVRAGKGETPGPQPFRRKERERARSSWQVTLAKERESGRFDFEPANLTFAGVRISETRPHHM